MPVDNFSRRFHDATSFDAFGPGSYASRNDVGFRGQPWSYLRLKAYSFIWLCEGAYGDFGGSVLDDNTQGLTHRLILALVPERRKNRLASRGSNAGRPDSRRRSSRLRRQICS